MKLFGALEQRGVGVGTMKQTAEVQTGSLGIELGTVYFNEIRAAYDILEMTETHLGQILPYFLGKEGVIIHQILTLAEEVGAKLGILGGNTHGAGIGMALAHKNAAEHNQLGSAEAEFTRAQQSHCNHIVTCLELTVHLHLDYSAQIVQHEGLLGFGKTYFGRNSGITY